MILETFVIWLILCSVVALLAYMMRSPPVAIVASIGFVIAGMEYYLDENDLFILGMLWMIGFVLPFAVTRKKDW